MSAFVPAPGGTPRVLSIAGSDPSGGAGIQADLKTFAALGVYGMAAITAITVQNTEGVRAVHPVAPELIRQQIDAVFDDIQVDAVKVGMLASAEAVEAVAETLARHRARNVVVDPVIAASDGTCFLDDRGIHALRVHLLPRTSVATPNLEEVAILLNCPVPGTVGEMEEAALRLQRDDDWGAERVYLKGGHLAGAACIDVFTDGERTIRLPGERIATHNTHGTGCTLSSALAAFLALGHDPFAAARMAKAYVTRAIMDADLLSVGSGKGPLNHAHLQRVPEAHAEVV